MKTGSQVLPRVLITTPRLSAGGGVSAFYRGILPHLEAHRDVSIQVLEVGASVRALPLLGDAYALFSALRSSSYSLVHINASLDTRSILRDGILCLLSNLRGVPVLVFFHGWNEALFSPPRRLACSIIRGLFRRASAFIVLAHRFRDQLAQLVGPAPEIHVLTTNVPDDFANAVRGRRDRPPVPAFDSDRPLRVLFLARVERDKGVFETIDAVSRLLQSGVPCFLTVAGNGTALAAAKEHAASKLPLSSFSFCGYVDGDEKVDVFLDHDIYCLPTSHGEGLPTSILEAMAAGLAIVTCPVGGIVDLNEKVSIGRILNEPKPESVAAALLELGRAPDELSSIGRQNAEYVYSNCLASVVASRLLSIFSQLADSRPKSDVPTSENAED